MCWSQTEIDHEVIEKDIEMRKHASTINQQGNISFVVFKNKVLTRLHVKAEENHDKRVVCQENKPLRD